MRRSDEAAWRLEQFCAFAVIVATLILAELVLGAATPVPLG